MPHDYNCRRREKGNLGRGRAILAGRRLVATARHPKVYGPKADEATGTSISEFGSAGSDSTALCVTVGAAGPRLMSPRKQLSSRLFAARPEKHSVAPAAMAAKSKQPRRGSTPAGRTASQCPQVACVRKALQLQADSPPSHGGSGGLCAPLGRPVLPDIAWASWVLDGACEEPHRGRAHNERGPPPLGPRPVRSAGPLSPAPAQAPALQSNRCKSLFRRGTSRQPGTRAFLAGGIVGQPIHDRACDGRGV